MNKKIRWRREKGSGLCPGRQFGGWETSTAGMILEKVLRREWNKHGVIESNDDGEVKDDDRLLFQWTVKQRCICTSAVCLLSRKWDLKSSDEYRGTTDSTYDFIRVFRTVSLPDAAAAKDDTAMSSSSSLSSCNIAISVFLSISSNITVRKSLILRNYCNYCR